MLQDYVLDGRGYGMGEVLANCRFNPALFRPYINRRGVPCVGLPDKDGKVKDVAIANLQAHGINSPVLNASVLPKDAWIEYDRAVTRAVRRRLSAWSDLVAAAPRNIGNAMGKMTLEYQSMSDPGEAVVDMDTLSDSRNDRHLYDIKSIPLPITHSGFMISERELQVSRQGGNGLDTSLAEAAAQRVAEMIEKTLLGIETGVTYGTRTTGLNPHVGTSTVYGYTNFPYRVTKTDLTTPTGSNPEAMLSDVLEMIEVMETNGYYGPYMLYHSTGYSRFLNDDYFRAGSTSAVRSVRERLMAIGDIRAIRRLDYLTTGYSMILIQMTPDVAQAINGMAPTLIQWDSRGGWQHNFRVAAIQVPLLKARYDGVTGILHATAA